MKVERVEPQKQS